MEKIRIAQIGVTHEHASGKMLSLKAMSDIFEIVGFVNDFALTQTPRLVETLHPCFDGLKPLTLAEVLNDPTIRAVTVEVPNNELVPCAMKFAEKGIAIHMDKPAGEDLALYKKLLDGCKAKHLPFQMGFMFRGNPAFRFCIRAIREKLIGEVFEIDADMNHGYGGESYQDYIAGFAGGIMYNLGCHLIDFVVAAMGRPEKVVPFLKSAPGYPGSCLNNCMAVLEYPHALATIRSCSKKPGDVEDRAMRIVGTNGTIQFSPLERFDGKGVEISLRLEKGSGTFPAGNHKLVFPPQRSRYAAQLQELAQAIRGRTLCDGFSAVHQQGMASVPPGQRQVMHHGDHCTAGLYQPALHHVEERPLEGQVQVVCRLIQDQQLRILRQYLGQEHPLCLSAGQRQHTPVPHIGNTGDFHRRTDLFRALRIPAAQESVMPGIPPQRDHLVYRKRIDVAVLLGQHADLPRKFLRGIFMQFLPFQESLSRIRHRPGQGACQR